MFTKKDLLSELKKANDKQPNKRIGYTYRALLRYEEKGIAIKPKNMTNINGKEWRFYTQDEIDENVRRVTEYKTT